MYEPMTANTLAEAAEWLAEATDERWTSRRVLDTVVSRSGDSRRSCLSVVPPRFTPFGFYQPIVDDPQKFTFCRLELNCRFPLTIECAVDIFDHGEGRASLITAPGEAGHERICIEPDGSYLVVKPEMLRIGRTELLAFFDGLKRQATLPRLPLLSMEAQRQKSGTADYDTTWWSLRVLANEYAWPQRESRPVIARCLSSMGEWDGTIIKRLQAGPPNGNVEHIPVQMGNTLKHRERILDPEIAHAMTLAGNASSAQSVFAELVKLATRQFGCLLEVVDNEVKYRSGDTALLFSIKNLRDRMRRDRAR